MAKKQNRRSISVRGLTYQRMKNHCDVTGVAISNYLERLIEHDLNAQGVAVPTKVEPKKPKPEPTSDEIASQL